MKSMISENISRLRKRKNLSQEDLASKIGVSRQTIAKWENGESIPDVAHCSQLADLFEISLDDLVHYNWSEDSSIGIPPKGRYIFGTVTVGEKGQIVIPAKARKLFHIKPGDDLMVLGDIDQGLALIDANFFLECFGQIQDFKKTNRGNSYEQKE